MILRMNKDFMIFMREHYGHVVSQAFGKTVVQWAQAASGERFEDGWVPRLQMSNHADTKRDMRRAEDERWMSWMSGSFAERRR